MSENIHSLSVPPYLEPSLREWLSEYRLASSRITTAISVLLAERGFDPSRFERIASGDDGGLTIFLRAERSDEVTQSDSERG